MNEWDYLVIWFRGVRSLYRINPQSLAAGRLHLIIPIPPPLLSSYLAPDGLCLSATIVFIRKIAKILFCWGGGILLGGHFILSLDMWIGHFPLDIEVTWSLQSWTFLSPRGLVEGGMTRARVRNCQYSEWDGGQSDIQLRDIQLPDIQLRTISFCDNQLLWQSAFVTISFSDIQLSVTISFCDNQLLWQSAFHDVQLFVTISLCDNQLLWQSAFHDVQLSVTISFCDNQLSWHSAFCDF